MPETAHRHVLVVDDDPATRDLLCRTLSGHCQGRAVGVENTAAALSVLRGSRIDLIVQDLFRAHGDGLELLATLQARPSLSTIPVIVVSGQAERYDSRARQLGARLFLKSLSAGTNSPRRLTRLPRPGDSTMVPPPTW